MRRASMFSNCLNMPDSPAFPTVEAGDRPTTGATALLTLRIAIRKNPAALPTPYAKRGLP
jgi:hypothetical protein